MSWKLALTMVGISAGVCSPVLGYQEEPCGDVNKLLTCRAAFSEIPPESARAEKDLKKILGVDPERSLKPILLYLNDGPVANFLELSVADANVWSILLMDDIALASKMFNCYRIPMARARREFSSQVDIPSAAAAGLLVICPNSGRILYQVFDSFSYTDVRDAMRQAVGRYYRRGTWGVVEKAVRLHRQVFEAWQEMVSLALRLEESNLSGSKRKSIAARAKMAAERVDELEDKYAKWMADLKLKARK